MWVKQMKLKNSAKQSLRTGSANANRENLATGDFDRRHKVFIFSLLCSPFKTQWMGKVKQSKKCDPHEIPIILHCPAWCHVDDDYRGLTVKIIQWLCYLLRKIINDLLIEQRVSLLSTKSVFSKFCTSVEFGVLTFSFLYFLGFNCAFYVLPRTKENKSE